MSVLFEEWAKAIRAAGRPLHQNRLIEIADQHIRDYSPFTDNDKFGEFVCYQGRPAEISGIQRGSNPKQGEFNILQLTFFDGSDPFYVVGGIVKTPDKKFSSASEHPIDWTICIALILGKDDRLIHLRNEQGDIWCLNELLPSVSNHELDLAISLLDEELTPEGNLITRSTQELVQYIWKIPNDGGHRYHCYAFAIAVELVKYPQVKQLGDRWVHIKAWEKMKQRNKLRPPRHLTILGDEDEPEEEEDRKHRRRKKHHAKEGGKTQERGDWRNNRPKSVRIVLRARNYYEGWLPLTERELCLFPPIEQEILLHHYFSDEPQYILAWVDLEDRRIWANSGMYDVFRQNRIYPGAKLALSFRTDREYDLATLPRISDEPVNVWRMWVEDDEIQYSLDIEPRYYDIDEDVFIADARFEDLPALFQQAEQASNSIFGLMYRKAEEWQKEIGDQKLFVTADKLFQAIHFDKYGRMTTKATIATELWQRLAFEPIGKGMYRFRPEFKSKIRPPHEGETKTQALQSVREDFIRLHRLKLNISKQTEKIRNLRPKIFVLRQGFISISKVISDRTEA